ncbi:MAG: TspO/MBR family protein [Candidatus Omnitrophota bacterium]|nr:tryptophan-rich sensory protein [Patescibacteria group bacterium]
MKNKSTFRLIVAILICQSAGLLGTLTMNDAFAEWYPSLVKPAFNPPGWVFGPAWILLYTLMGIALYVVWQKKKSKNRDLAIAAFAIQLVLNAMWTPIFFGMQQVFYALLDISLLWIMIALTIYLFSRISKAAAWLLVPYLAWVTFAMILNYSIWQLNMV